MMLATLLLTVVQVGSCRQVIDGHLHGHLHARAGTHQHQIQEVRGAAVPAIPDSSSSICPALQHEAVDVSGLVRAKNRGLGARNLPHTETVQVITSVQRAGTAQILPSPTGRKPDTIGYIETSLEDQGRYTEPPLLTGAIQKPTALLKAVATLSVSAAIKINMASQDIFADPIATGAPPASIPKRHDHPVPRLGIAWTPPLATNKFYANKYLGNQTCPDFLHPYSVAWARGQGASASWGMAISHIEANQRVYGPTSADTGAASYFINPIGIQALAISAQELGSSTTLTTDHLQAFSVKVSLRPSANASAAIEFPLVQGAGFITAIFNGAQPLIQSGVFFRSIRRASTDPKPGVTKYKIGLEDGSTWLLYAYNTKGDRLNLQVTNNSVIRSTGPFYGTIQVTKDPGNGETIYDQASGAYATGVALSGTASGTTGTYTFKFQKGGMTGSTLVMFALPHHQTSFDDLTKAAMTDVRLQTTTKGVAALVLADSWTMIESSLPTEMGFSPWSPTSGAKDTISQGTKNFIHKVASSEVSQDMDQQTNLDSMYFSGKVSKTLNRRITSFPPFPL